MKKTYEMNGKTYKTLSAIAKELGVSRIRSTQLDKYGITIIDPDVVSDVVSDVAPVDTEVKVESEADVDEVNDESDEVPEDESDKADEDEPNVADAKASNDDGESDNSVVDDSTDEAPDERNTEVVAPVQAKAVSKLDIDDIIALVTKIGGNLYESIQSVPIRRMHLVMELKKHGAYTATPAKVSPWKSITTEEIEKLIKKNKVSWVKCDNSGINRMRMIMALKKNGIQPESHK